MNFKYLTLTLTIITGLLFTSCEKENEPSKPEISHFELGLDNSKTAVTGSDLHIEAEVLADAKINYITIEIHPEGEDEKSLSLITHEEEWEFDSTFTDGINGVKNTEFHKHIEIPAEAPVGDYHFHFSVSDMDGNRVSTEEELSLQAPDDSIFPVVTITEAPAENAAFGKGESIRISGSVSDNIALGGMYIGLVRQNQNLTDAEVNAANTVTVLHTHDFDEINSHEFDAEITVGAVQDNNITPKDISGDLAWQSANYYLIVKCKDEFGGNWTFSEQYPIIINY